MLLYYVRHGDPIYDPDSLTPLGCRQAEAVAKRLSVYGLDQIFVSSSNRAKQTAQPTCELLHKEATILDWCNEEYAWNSLTVLNDKGHQVWGFQCSKTRKVFVSSEMERLGGKWYTHPLFKGTRFQEGIERIQRETDHFLAEQGFVFDAEHNMYRVERQNEDRVALFAHQGFGLAFLSCLLHIPYPMFSTRFDINHSAITVVQFATQDEYIIPTVLTLSNDSHLYHEGLPTKFQNGIPI